MSPETRAKVIAGLAERWNLTYEDTVELREIGHDDECLADLIRIAGLLSPLFRDVVAEVEWLYERRAALDNMPAMMLMLDGKRGLRRVRETVEHMSGL